MSLALNVAITVAEIIGGLMAGSLALLSDAAHNLSDVAALGLALGRRRLGRRPPTPRHTYGLKRAEVIAALVNAVSLVGRDRLIAREAVVAAAPSRARSIRGVMLTVALVALGANVGSVLLLRRHDEGDVNVRSAFLHLAQDALASLAVVVAALLAHTAVGAYRGSAAALFVGAGVLRARSRSRGGPSGRCSRPRPTRWTSRRWCRASGSGSPPARLHHLHVWEIGPGSACSPRTSISGRRWMDGRSRRSAPSRCSCEDEWGMNHATLEPEVVGCEDPALLGRWGRGRRHRDRSRGGARD